MAAKVSILPAIKSALASLSMHDTMYTVNDYFLHAFSDVFYNMDLCGAPWPSYAAHF